ncbi:hypothetical protein JY651_09355 [Pyxidicoccus parkwayensis]|uniref:Lipoprotein n=1 Tax=Pyxidicoccus parkwayensis TaxID=2813578 RepID=A0ABX7P3U0_9BACT|nr:hypothetical protein [Pyxidicoccus parkwaysis]QSQ25112.1 hypothetical protein JY651_09355 [Pyxidicoccus parkwaysis]
MLRSSHLAAVLVFLAAGGTAVASGSRGFLTRELPAGSYRAETFTMGIPKELGKAHETLARSVAAKHEWFQDYMSKLNLKPGEPLPYTPEMGLSEAEYAALLKAYQQPTMMSLTTTDVRVTTEKGVTRFQAAPPHDFLNAISIDSSGKLTGNEIVVQPKVVKSQRAKFGVWSGTTWFHEAADLNKGDARAFEFSIGKLDDTGRVFVVLTDKFIKGRQRVASNQFMAWLSQPAGAGAH